MKIYSLRIKRYYDVVADKDLKTIDNILTDRNWIMQASQDDDTKTFFQSFLSSDEHQLLGELFSSVLLEYIKEHNISFVDVILTARTHYDRIFPLECHIRQTQLRYMGHVIRRDGLGRSLVTREPRRLRMGLLKEWLNLVDIYSTSSAW